MRRRIQTLICFVTIGLYPLLLFAEPPSCGVMPEAQRQARRIRKLSFKRNVPCRVYTQEQVRKFIQETIEEELPESRIENEEYVFKTLKLIPDSYEYGEGIVELYLSQIGGFYDPKEEFFAMAGWMPAMFQMPIMVHELVHGLQDQYYQLDDFLDSKTMTTDEVLARSALVEGDATAVMMDYARALSGQGPIEKESSVTSMMLQNVIGSELSAGFMKAPESLRLLLLFPYASGLRFAHALLQGGSYREIDKAFAQPPATTQEILHPELYPRKNQKKKAQRLRKNFMRTNKERVVLHEDVLGEFGLALVLRSIGISHVESSKLATHWNIDRLMLFTSVKEKRYFEWRVDFDRPENAKKILEIFKKNLIRTFKDGTKMSVSKQQTLVTVTRGLDR